MKKQNFEIIILSGLSGSGKSAALHTLEDMGYFTIDNLPGALFPHFISFVKNPTTFKKNRHIALVMDAREKEFLKNHSTYLKLLQTKGIRFRIIFLDTQDDILIRRFSETRRRHPLAPQSRVPTGIQMERELLHPLRERATIVIDTSYLNIHELRKKIRDAVQGKSLQEEVSIHVTSFGYRYGVPLEADLVFDMRFLPNPHFVRKLRPFTGLNASVAQFVHSQNLTRDFFKHFQPFLQFLLQSYLKEGKSYLTIAFGCTGGRHRSVAIAQKVFKDLKRKSYPVRVLHRDVKREVS